MLPPFRNEVYMADYYDAEDIGRGPFAVAGFADRATSPWIYEGTPADAFLLIDLADPDHEAVARWPFVRLSPGDTEP